MRELKANDLKLRGVTRGLELSAADLPGGRIEGGRILFKGGAVRLVADRRFGPGNGWAVAKARGGFDIAAATPAGFVSGLLNLGERTARGEDAEGEVVPRFASRFYKHEANIIGGNHPHTHVAQLDEAFWIGYAKALARLHFNGLVFYTAYHPFQYYLDYGRFAEAGEGTRRRRAQTLLGLRRAFGIARAFGLKTFMQHYVTHFPPGLSGRLGLGLSEAEGDSRLAALDHPVVDEYSRYVYRRTFEVLPELSGFYCNFESSANSAEFVLRTLYPEAARRKVMPELVFRLWDFNSLPEMVRLVRAYPGKVRLGHKIMDHADVYYVPKADRRVIEWKRALPDIEFMFLAGPCHNTATTISRRLWSDPEFVRATLADAQRKGADSISFHTVFELLCPDIDARKVAGQREIHMATLNRGHLDAAVDYVRGVTPTAAVLAKRTARRLRISTARAAKVDHVMKEASQIPLLMHQQYFATSSLEGYLDPGRNTFYADPFFYPPMTFVNDEPKLAMNLYTSWLNTAIRTRYIPDDVQAVIDFVDPGKPKAARNPAVIARFLRRHGETALRLAREAAGSKPLGAMETLVGGVTHLFHWGMRVRQEILASAGLYAAYFSRSKGRTIGSLKRALAALEAVRPHVRKGDATSARVIPLLEEATTERDARLLRRLIRHIEGRRFPYEAFAAYARSLAEYNEIRRTVRPYKAVRPEETRIIRRQLATSARRARESCEILSGARHRDLRRNVARWLRYVETELAGVTPPSYAVKTESALGDEEGFVQLFHDQCFRRGENCIGDFDAFFTPADFPRREPIYFRAASSREGLVLSVCEEGVDVTARRERWRRFAGTGSDSYFARLWLDREGDGRRTEVFRIHHEGRWLFREALTVLSRQHTKVELSRPVTGGTARFRARRDSWRLDYVIPWKELGGRPSAGTRWRANVTSNPSIARNRQNIWCPGYEFVAGKAARMGTFVFR